MQKTYNFKEGEILVFNKPLHWTSFDIVNKVRISLKYIFGESKIKVGHAGTLDPLATGVLILCTGKATKNIDLIQASEKEYIATIRLGATTPSFDKETEIDQEFPYHHISHEEIIRVLSQFTGVIMQIPPVYSAISINGKRAYSIARKGETIEINPRQIEIYQIELIKMELPTIVIRVVCSKGTYIRSLARDIGTALNSGGYLEGLIRTRSGFYTLENAMTIEQFLEMLEKLKIDNQN